MANNRQGSRITTLVDLERRTLGGTERMTKAFNIADYYTSLGNELILAFAQGALATTPVNIGRSREKAVRIRLRQLLPSGIGIGSGLVVDTQGNTSKQIDIILYEDNICPSLVLNDDDETSYFPCEGVIAVGEVKSTIGTREADDINEKIASVRKLDRWCRPQDSGLGLCVDHRSYGTRTVFAATPDNQYEQNSAGKDQIWGFGIAGAMSISERSLMTKLNTQCEVAGAAYCPNLVITTSGLGAAPCKHDFDSGGNSLVWSAIEANGYLVINAPQALAYLVKEISKVFDQGRTVDAEAFRQYIPSPEQFEIVTGQSFSNEEGVWGFLRAG